MSSSRFPSPDEPHGDHANSAAAPLNICIASSEFLGPSVQGATGMAYTAMAQALSGAGHHVTCLFLGTKTFSESEWQRWVDKYKEDGLSLIALPQINASELVAPRNLIKSYEAYQWLKRNDRFDIIHFPERQGPGYHSLTAKHHGLAFRRAMICVGLHSMTAWLQSPDKKPANALAEVDTDFMERRAVALADAVVTPTHSLVDWISEQHRDLPRQKSAAPASQPVVADSDGINELVYFGTLEARQGLALFCDGLDALDPAIAKKIQVVTFLGHESIIAGIPARNYIKKRALGWRFPFQVIAAVQDLETMDYLRQRNRLTVIPSLPEGSPYRVLECLVARITFLATRVGGVTELIAAEDVDKVCFEPTAAALSKILGAALANGVCTARATIDCPTTAAASAPALTEDAAQAIQALSIDPSDAVALKVLARIHLKAGLAEAAEEACHLVLKADADDAEALAIIGEARNQKEPAPENILDSSRLQKELRQTGAVDLSLK